MSDGENIIALTFEEIARKTNDPFIYVMIFIELGFHVYTDKVRAIKAWNKIHPDKSLPLPKGKKEFRRS